MSYNRCVYYKCGNISSDISMFRFPVRDKRRLVLWIRNSGNIRLNSLSTEKLRRRYICAAHFPQSSIHKNNMRSRLIRAAVPVPFCSDKVGDGTSNPTHKETADVDGSDASAQSRLHEDIKCDACGVNVVGFRYACLQCANYDLCATCEAACVHPAHYMLRIPSPGPPTEIAELLRRIRNELESGDIWTATQAETDITEPNEESVIKIEIKNEVDPGPDPLQDEIEGLKEIKTEPLEHPEMTETNEPQTNSSTSNILQTALPDDMIQTPSTTSDSVKTANKRAAPQQARKEDSKKARESLELQPNTKLVEVRCYPGPGSAGASTKLVPPRPPEQEETERSSGGFIAEVFTHYTKEDPPERDKMRS